MSKHNSQKRERKGRTVSKAEFLSTRLSRVGSRVCDLDELAKSPSPPPQQRHHEGTNAEHHPHHVNASLEKLAEQVKALAANQAALQNSIAQMSSRGGIPISVVGEEGTFNKLEVAAAANETTSQNIGAAEKACFGDHVFFGHNHGGRFGILSGDAVLNRCGIELVPEDGDDRSIPKISLDFTSCVFAILPMLSYRARAELRNFNKALEQNAEDAQASDAKEKRKRKKLLYSLNTSEASKNEEVVSSILGGAGGTIKYGDTVQLLHTQTNLFLKLSKKTASMDKDSRKVSMRHGSPGVLFKLMPRFQNRALGTPVYYEDEIVFESVKHEGLQLNVSYGPDFVYPSAWKHAKHPGSDVLPEILQRMDQLEVNGARTRASFVLKEYARFPAERCLRANQLIRLYQPVAEGFVRASCDTDKRRFVNRAERRLDGSMAHQVYISRKSKFPDPNHPANKSAKAVWAFEYIDRSKGGSIQWNGQFRLRHVGSGKYLSVDTLSIVPRSSADEGSVGDAFRCGLVRMPSSVPPGGLGSPESLVFTLQPVDGSEGDLPDGVASLRIVHETSHENGETVTCYLHHVAEEKSCFPSVTKEDDEGEGGGKEKTYARRKGEQLCFITERSPRDVMRIMPLDADDVKDIVQLKGLMAPLKLFSYLMINAKDTDEENRPIDGTRFPEAATAEMDSIANVLLQLTQLNLAGSNNVLARSVQNWSKIATNSLPAKFSNYFTGEARPFRQALSKDLKLIDAVFECSIAAYNRYAKVGLRGKSPFAPAKAPPDLTNPEDLEDFQENERNERNGPEFISKLSHVCLQKLIFRSHENAKYFSRRESLYRPLNKSPSIAKELHWIDIISLQSEDPLGATVTLSRLLVGSAEIARQIVSPKLLLGFLQLIQRNGPQPRLIQLFSATCICDGQPITENQEMVLRMLWLDSHSRSGALINLLLLERSEVQKFGAVQGKASSWPNYRDNAPANYIGKDDIEANNCVFAPTYVTWSGSKNWIIGSEDLFYDWEGLGMPSRIKRKTPTGEDCIPIEWLCYVLSPERLSMAVTGKEYEPFNEERAGEVEIAKNQQFRKHLQLAEYFVAELQLFVNMAKGRSYNVISWLTKEDGFSYTMLIGLASNPHLPHTVRSEIIYLLLVLYVDRFPQLPRSGRPYLPEKLWCFDDTETSKADGGFGVPKVREVQLNDANVLPTFSLSSQHLFSGNSDPVLGHPDDFKFFLLRQLTNEIVLSFGGNMVVSHTAENQLACAALFASQQLLNFGFSSSYPKLRQLLMPAATILDGRSDEESRDEHGPQYFVPATDRWRDINGASFQAVTLAKKSIIQLLETTSDFRANYRLARFLWVFKSQFQTDEAIIELEKIANDAPDQNPATMETIEKEFEALFNAPDDAVKLDLAEITGTLEQFEHILVDAMQYEDDRLFESSLELLDRRFGQRRKLIDALSHVYLLESESCPVFGKVSHLQAKLGTLLYSFRSTAVWGVHSVVSGGFNENIFESVGAICKDLISFVSSNDIAGESQDLTKVQRPTKVIAHHQNILRSLDMQSILMVGLQIDINLAFKGSNCTIWQKLRSQEILITTLEHVLKSLLYFKFKNPVNQELLFDGCLHLLVNLCSLKTIELPAKPADLPPGDKYPTENPNSAERIRTLARICIIETMRGNPATAKRLPEAIFDRFGQFINEREDLTTCEELEFFFLAATPVEGQSIRRNQVLCLAQLLRTNLVNVFGGVKNSIFAAHAMTKELHGWGLVGKSFFAKDTVTTPEGSSKRLKDPTRVMKLVASLADFSSAVQRIGQELGATMAMLLKETAFILSAALNIAVPQRTVGSRRRNSVKSKDSNFDEHKDAVHKMLAASHDWEYLMAHAEELLSYIQNVSDLDPSDPELIRTNDLWDFFRAADEAIAHFVGANGNTAALATVGPSCCISEVIVVKLLSIVESFLVVASASGLFDDIKQTRSRWSIINDIGNISCREIVKKYNDTHSLTEELGTQASHLIATCGFTTATLFQVPAEEREEAKEEIDFHSNPMLPKESVKAKAALLENFVLAVKKGPNIQAMIQKRRFALVDQLEVEMVGYLDARGNINADGEHKRQKAQANITWTTLVRRFIAYGNAHFFEEACDEHMVRICTILRYSLLKARSIPESLSDHLPAQIEEFVVGGSIDFNELNVSVFDDRRTAQYVSKLLADHRGKVKLLIEEGVMDLMCEIIGKREIGNQVFEEAFLLSKELIHSASKVTQGRLLILLRADFENRFLNKIAQCFEVCSEGIREHRRLQLKSPSKEFVTVMESGISTVEYLQGLCEGHFRAIQDHLRFQEGHAGNLDVIKVAVDLSCKICESTAAVRSLSPSEVTLLKGLFDFFTESMQGPCPENQVQIASGDAVVAVKNMLLVPLAKDIGPVEEFELRSSAVKVLKSCLEGRNDEAVHQTLAASVEAAMLHQYELNLNMRIKGLHGRDLLPSAQDDEGADIDKEMIMDSIVDAKTIEAELINIPSYARKLRDAKADNDDDDDAADADDDDDDDDGDGEEAHREKADQVESDNLLDFVEISWRGEIERIVFSPPSYTSCLKDEQKTRFLETVDLSTTERRVKQLVQEVESFRQEMKNTEYFVQKLSWYRFVDKNFFAIKGFVYGCCVLLNLNILFSNEKLRSPYDLLYDCPEDEKHDGHHCKIDDDIMYSFIITAILGLLNFFGYFVIVWFIALTEVPLIITRTRIEAARAVDTVPKSEWRNYKPFVPAFLFFSFAIAFWQIITANFDGSPFIYGSLIAASGIWFLKCLRELVVVPDTIPLQIFVILYDLYITKPFLRNHIFLQILSLLGLSNNKWFSIMLFDVFNNSTMLQDIIRSVTQPGIKLLMILYTILITCAVFAQFGLREFGPTEFNLDDTLDDEEYTCHSTFTCFVVIFSKGVPIGTISDLLAERTVNDGGIYWERIVFDLAFFVWMGILLFNIITGLMIDTFGELREESNNREDVLQNSCYICGITRAAYDDLGLPPDAPTFDVHIEEEHSLWSYLFFLCDLKDKNPKDYDGRESYVYSEIQKASFTWLPNRTSFEIESLAKKRQRDDAYDVDGTGNNGNED